MADFFTALWALAHSPLVIFLAVFAVGLVVVKVKRWYSSLPGGGPNYTYKGEQISRYDYQALKEQGK